MNSKQFAWMYLLLNGKANVKPNYYGGWEIVDQSVLDLHKLKRNNINDIKILQEKFLTNIKNIGIDWEKTPAPITEIYSEFAGTDSPSDDAKYLEGMLYLNDGSWQFWMAEEPSNDNNMFDMMANIEIYKAKFAELNSLAANNKQLI